jgi:hypothetical protein
MRAFVLGLAFAAICSVGLAAPAEPPVVRAEGESRYPPCPAEQLSCGKQTPVTSDGARVFKNDEMGLQAVFPEGSRVCMSRSGDAPRGFYAWYGTTVAGCPERGDIPAAFMGISSSFNALAYKSLQQAAHNCAPLSPRVKKHLKGASLSVAGHSSVACQSGEPDGALRITVYTMGGKPTEEGVPSVIYFASLVSQNARLDHDLAMFRTFLHRVRVGVP